MVLTYNDDWVNTCMEYRVEGRGPIGRPRKTWLESVDADMAELEIDKEDVHDKKMEKECYEEKVQPYRKIVSIPKDNKKSLSGSDN